MTVISPPQATPLAIKVYVGSKKSDKYHYPTCTSAKRILTENEIWFSSAEDAQSKGYSPCRVCKPPLTGSATTTPETAPRPGSSLFQEAFQ